MDKTRKVYVYVHPDGHNSLFGTSAPAETFDMPTLSEALKIEPDFIAGSRQHEVLVFADVTVQVSEHNAEDGQGTAEEAFEVWKDVLNRLDNEQRIRFLGMVYNDRFNAGEPIDVNEALDY